MTGTPTKNSGNRGFTLIELMVVISIIGVLSTVVLSSIQIARQKASDAAKITNVDAMNTDLNIYYNDHGYAPLTAPPYITPVSVSDLWLGDVLVPGWNDIGASIGMGAMPHGKTYPNHWGAWDYYEYFATYNTTQDWTYPDFCLRLPPLSYAILVTLENQPAKGGLVPGTNYYIVGGGGDVTAYQNPAVCP